MHPISRVPNILPHALLSRILLPNPSSHREAQASPSQPIPSEALTWRGHGQIHALGPADSLLAAGIPGLGCACNNNSVYHHGASDLRVEKVAMTSSKWVAYLLHKQFQNWIV